MVPGPEAVCAALADLAPDRARPVEVRETHISWVFLVGDRAYKLKKPIVLPFLDYGTPERRRAMCQEEVRLNRRLAPAIYLGVRALVATPDGLALGDEDDPRAIDYVVEMRRFDEADTLAARLERGDVQRSDMAEIGQLLARFHDGARHVPAAGIGTLTVQRRVTENIHELLTIVEQRAEIERVLALERFAHAYVVAHAHTLAVRAQRGRGREGHGDLRAEHVVLRDGVQIVDCIEFDAGLREIDVADDVAFLVMDLVANGAGRFARALVDAYRGAGGDPGDDGLIAFYAAHRALVRAKVGVLRAAQEPADSAARGHESARARDLLFVAEHFAWQARLPLALVICGVPASGKSVLAQALAAASDLAHLSSDRTRKELVGVAPTETAPADAYRAEISARTYAALGRRAARQIAAHGGVIVDATFRHRADRDAFCDAFADAAPLVFVECHAPPDVLARRAARRDRQVGQTSDATAEVVARERSSWEPLDEVDPRAHIALRSDRRTEMLVADLLALLDQRLAA